MKALIESTDSKLICLILLEIYCLKNLGMENKEANID